jgi:hypothetical protein
MNLHKHFNETWRGEDKIEDIKGVIRRRRSKDRQYNGQTKKTTR